MSKLDTLLNIQQSLTAEQIRKQNEVLVNATIDNNSEIKKLYKQLNETNVVNKEILKNQIKEARHNEEQNFYKAFVFKVSEIVDTITEIEDSILKYYFNKNALNGTTDEIENVIEKLDEISDKQSTKEIYKKVEMITKELMPLSGKYNASKFPKLTSLFNDYIALEASIPQKPEFKTNGREIKKNKIIFWAIFHSIGTIASLIIAFNNYPIIGGFFAFMFGWSVVREVLQNGVARTFQRDQIVYNNLVNNYDKKKAEIISLLENHEIHSYIATISSDYTDYAYYAKELEKIETKFHEKWGN